MGLGERGMGGAARPAVLGGTHAFFPGAPGAGEGQAPTHAATGRRAQGAQGAGPGWEPDYMSLLFPSPRHVADHSKP